MTLPLTARELSAFEICSYYGMKITDVVQLIDDASVAMNLPIETVGPVVCAAIKDPTEDNLRPLRDLLGVHVDLGECPLAILLNVFFNDRPGRL